MGLLTNTSPNDASQGARAALGALQGDLVRARSDLAALQAGRAKLADRIAAAEAKVEEARAADDAEAAGLVNAIRNGAAAFVSFTRRREPLPDVAVATLALAKADAAIAEKAAEIESLASRVAPAVAAVLRSEAHQHVEEYGRALAAAVAAAARLAGLAAHFDPAESHRRVLDAPGFSLAGDLIDRRPVAIETETISAASRDWAQLAAALAVNPRVAAENFIGGALAAANPTVTYAELSAPERRLVDVRLVREA